MQGATDHERNRATPSAATPDVQESSTWGLGDDAARPLRALGAVLGDLAALRYDARWIGLPASALGAPHRRFRVFILATRPDAVPDTVGVGLLPRRRDLGAGKGPARDDRAVASGDRSDLDRSGCLIVHEERNSVAVVSMCE